MDNTNQPNNPNIPNANPGRTLYNPYDGELQSPFSTDLHGNPTTEGGPQRISRNNRYSTPNTTVGPLTDPLLPLLLLLALSLLIRVLLRKINLPPSEGKTRE